MSLLQEDVEVLRRVPLFASVETAKLKLLAFASQRLRFTEGQTLFRQGDEGDVAYVIVSGSVDVLVRAGDADARVATLGRNDIIGEIALLCDMPRTATVRPSSPVEALAIKKGQLVEVIRHSPDMALAVMRVLAERLTHTSLELAEARRGPQALR